MNRRKNVRGDFSSRRCSRRILPSESDVRGRSPTQRPSDAERGRSLSSEKILDPIHSRLSKSNEAILQPSSSQTAAAATTNEIPVRPERISKSEDRSIPSATRTMTPMNDLQIQKCHILKEKFERQQPIDTVFGQFELKEKRVQLSSSFCRSTTLSIQSSASAAVPHGQHRSAFARSVFVDDDRSAFSSRSSS